MAHPAMEARWSAGRAAIGGWITTGSEQLIDAYGAAGYDYVGIDCQHTLTAEPEVARLVARRGGTPFAIIVRVARNEPGPIGRVVDAGADGVIVPLVETAEDAAAAVAAVRYPPHGARSFGPIRGDLGWNIAELQARVSVFVMVETAKGLHNITEICSVEGLAGIYVGPADLSISLGLEPTKAFTTDQVEGPLTTIREACDAAGLVTGAHAMGGHNAVRWEELGCRLISLRTDLALFTDAARSDLADARDLPASRQAPDA